MSREYAMSRVKDALDQSEGNHLKASRLIMEWLENDNSLYFGLTAPHMKSIVTHAIAHVDQKPTTEEPILAKHLQLGENEIGELGNAILAGIAGKPGSFGESNPEGTPKPSKASQQHIDALNVMTAAYKQKKKE